jgi:two-component system sensor histidine kinase KdpD
VRRIEAPRTWTRRFQGRATGSAISSIAIAALVAALRPVRLDLGLTNVALALLLVAVASAALWGWVVGLFATLLSNLAFDFFFVPPLYRLQVQRPENVLALVLFLLVSAITAALLARWRRSAFAAERGARETSTLLALNRSSRSRPLDEIPALICAWIVRDFAVRGCSIYRLVGGSLPPIAHAGAGDAALTPGESIAAHSAARHGSPVTLGSPTPDEGDETNPSADAPAWLFLPLAVEGETVGIVRLLLAGGALPDEQTALLEGFVDEAAAALHRAALNDVARTAGAARESDRLKSVLLASVSHDLRTPLTAIKAAAANLLSRDVAWSDGARDEFLQAIDREADRLNRMVADLLDISRIEGGALRLERDWNDLEELLREAVYRVERAAGKRRIAIRHAAPLPLLRFDYMQIDRVVANLIDNALKYSPPGSRILISTRVSDGSVDVAISDSGPGVARAARERIFSPFYREKRSERDAPGSGLGLAISRGIVEAHGGRIWVDDGPGATFHFTLPVEAAPPEADATAAPPFEAVR